MSAPNQPDVKGGAARLFLTPDQRMGMARFAVAWFAGLVTGIFIGKGWITAAMVGELADVINDFVGPVAQLAGTIATVGGLIWTYIANSKKSILASATKMPEVVEPIVLNDPKLAQQLPGTVVAK